MQLGKALKTCRNYKGLSLKQLSEKCNLSIAYLSLLEKDKRDPNLDTLNKICISMSIPICIVIFLASDGKDLQGIGTALVGTLSSVALDIIKEKRGLYE